MRIALVSPYSWTFPGGVTRHVDDLARALMAQGHEVRVLSPVDPDDRLTRALHRRRPESDVLPDYVVPLGRTGALRANGSVSNLAVFPESLARLRSELRAGRFDVVHVHEPIAPVVGWDACCFDGAPVVGTFHAYSTKWLPNSVASLLGARRIFNKLHARIAVSNAARWTGERYFGGRYDVIPNGVDLAAAPDGRKPEHDGFKILFVGRDDARKGLPVLLAAFAGLREHVPARLELIGASTEAMEPFVADLNGGTEDVEFHGSVDDAELWRRLHAADVLCAPSLGGESFGMVLIEAFAAGTPVVASDIGGYRDVVTDGRDGILVPPAQPLELAEALRSLYLDSAGRERMAAAARKRAADFAWPHVADEVSAVYQRALEAPAPRSAGERAAVRTGLRPADLGPRRPARRIPSLEPALQPARARFGSVARRAGVALSPLFGIVLAYKALQHVDLHQVLTMLVRSSPSWVLISLALFSVSMILRAASWHGILRAALPHARIKRRVVLSGTMIGVLMSATLPARLGEPSRALIVARRIGRMRETFPVVVGTLVSQTLINLLALALLGVLVASTSTLFRGHEAALALVGAVPAALVAMVVVAPWVLESNGRLLSRFTGTAGRVLRSAVAALIRLRRGLQVFRRPRYAAWAIGAQLAAWVLQLLGAFALMAALGIDSRVGVGAAAAVLFAVNVTAVLPVTPSNVGVFQFAVVTVLTGVYGVPATAALGYGIILQAVELATAVAFGLPALIGEGLSWRDVRLRALSATPVELAPRESGYSVRQG
jgi:phosphatidylinositol alpha-mannosyltransferase